MNGQMDTVFSLIGSLARNFEKRIRVARKPETTGINMHFYGHTGAWWRYKLGQLWSRMRKKTHLCPYGCSVSVGSGFFGRTHAFDNDTKPIKTHQKLWNMKNSIGKREETFTESCGDETVCSFDKKTRYRRQTSNMNHAEYPPRMSLADGAGVGWDWLAPRGVGWEILVFYSRTGISIALVRTEFPRWIQCCLKFTSHWSTKYNANNLAEEISRTNFRCLKSLLRLDKNMWVWLRLLDLTVGYDVMFTPTAKIEGDFINLE